MGNKTSALVTNGAHTFTEEERETNDYYATPPEAVEKLLSVETFKTDVWECACGGGHISEVLRKHNYNVYSTDIIDRNYKHLDEIKDFLFFPDKTKRDIITNPPYSMATEFARTANEIIQDGGKIAMLLKLTFLETETRRELFRQYPPKTIYVFTSRIMCGKGGVFTGESGAVCYAWYIWEKGFNGDPVIKWI